MCLLRMPWKGGVSAHASSPLVCVTQMIGQMVCVKHMIGQRNSRLRVRLWGS